MINGVGGAFIFLDKNGRRAYVAYEYIDNSGYITKYDPETERQIYDVFTDGREYFHTWDSKFVYTRDNHGSESKYPLKDLDEWNRVFRSLNLGY
jgi:hypothetical protein